MPNAARQTDPTEHGGQVSGGSETVRIGGLPAARLSDPHTCPRHSGGPVKEGSGRVYINGRPAARVGDAAVCPGGDDHIAQGCPTVHIAD